MQSNRKHRWQAFPLRFDGILNRHLSSVKHFMEVDKTREQSEEKRRARCFQLQKEVIGVRLLLVPADER